MSTDTATGYLCEFCDREFDTENGAALHERQWCKDNPDATRPNVGRPRKEEVDEPVAETPPVDPSPFDEDAPAEPAKRPWREKLWGPGDAERLRAPATKGERQPRKRRKSTAGIWEVFWTGFGRALIFTTADVPVGNAMTFQGPVVGPILDKAIAGTFLDTLLQPLAGAGERFEDVSDVLAVPTLVGIMERAPQLAPGLEPLLRKAIRRHLVEYSKMAKAQKKADQQYKEALADLGMQDVGEDPVDGIIAQIWAHAEPVAANQNGHSGAEI